MLLPIQKMKRILFQYFITSALILSLGIYAQVFANTASIDPSFDTWLPVGFNNTVQTIAIQNDGKFLVGGIFSTYKWVISNRIVRLSTDGTKDASFTIWSWFDNTVQTIKIQSDGKILVGGLFTTYNWSIANRIIRLNVNWTIDSSFTIWSWFDNTVQIIKIQSDGKILVGGNFTNYKWTSVSKIIRFNTDGTRDSTFSIWSWFNNTVQTIAIQNDGKILIGGLFTWYDWTPVNRIIRLNTNGAIDASFTIWSWFNTTVQTIAIQNDGKIIVGGNFTNYKWSSANYIARLYTDGSNDALFNTWSLFNNPITTIILQNDGKAVVGWYFTTQWSSAKNKIVRMNIDGTRDSSFTIWIWFSDYVQTIAIQNDGKIIIGGNFITYSWTSANKITYVYPNWNRDTSFDIWSGFDATINVLATQNDGKILVGGSFIAYKWSIVNKFIRLNTDGTKDSSFNIWNWFSDYVQTIAIQNDGKILVGGNFTTYNWNSVSKIIRLNTDGTKDSSFNIWSWFDNTVGSISVQNDGKIIAGGAFTKYKWSPINRLIRLNADGTIDSSFTIWSWFNDYIQTISLQNDGKILVGGLFTTYNGYTANRLIRLNSDWTRDDSFFVWNWCNSAVHSIMTQPDGKILVAGLFTTYSWSTIKNKIVRLTTGGAIDVSFNIWNWFDAPGINALAIQSDGKIIAGWWFTKYNWTTVNKLIRLNTGGSIDTTFNIWTWFNDYVNSLIIKNDGKIIVGGQFTSYNWLSAWYLVSFYWNSDLVILPNSNDTNVVSNEFTNKWYIKTGDNLVWSKAISLTQTNGNIPVALNIKNEDIKLSLTANTQLKEADSTNNYNGIISVPINKSVNSVADEQVLSAFKVGSSSESIKLTWWTANLLISVPGKSIWTKIQVYYSEDNGVTWYPQTTTSIVSYNGQPYISFWTNHFTDFAVTLPAWWGSVTWSFVINNDAISTTSSGVTLNISTTPSANQMRFSNDNLTRSNREPYVTTTVWMLPWTYWHTTVYAQFDIGGDGIADIQTNDSINYTAPWWWGSHGSNTWNLRLQIITSSWSCSYGTSLYIGSHPSQFAAYDMTGSNFSSSFSCIDTEGLSGWTMTMEATTDLSDGAQTISKDNVSLIASPNYVSAGACITGTNQDSWVSIGSTPGTILWKFSGQWDICTITSDTVNLAVHIPASQAVGLYTGTLTLNMPF